MVERICPRCQHGSPLENQFCGRCGSPLTRQLPAPRSEQGLIIAGRQLPVTLRQVSQSVAIGLAAIAAEAGLAWLRSRVERPQGGGTPRQAIVHTPHPTPSAVEPVQGAGDITTIISQRVLEVWEHGELTRKIVERAAWRRQSS